MKILAIDPGNVTGVSFYTEEGAPSTNEIPGGLFGFVDWWHQEGWWEHTDMVAVEDFIIKADTHKKTREPAAYELVGWVKGKCHEENIPLDVIGPGEHTGFSAYKVKKRSKLVRLGWSNPSKDHHADSASSLLLLAITRHDPVTANALLGGIATNV